LRESDTFILWNPNTRLVIIIALVGFPIMVVLPRILRKNGF